MYDLKILRFQHLSTHFGHWSNRFRLFEHWRVSTARLLGKSSSIIARNCFLNLWFKKIVQCVWKSEMYDTGTEVSTCSRTNAALILSTHPGARTGLNDAVRTPVVLCGSISPWNDLATFCPHRPVIKPLVHDWLSLIWHQTSGAEWYTVETVTMCNDRPMQTDNNICVSTCRNTSSGFYVVQTGQDTKRLIPDSN